MKIIFSILLVSFCLYSCKKDYTCECTTNTTYSYPSAPPPSTSTTRVVYKEKKQSDAQSKCEGQKSSMSSPGFYQTTTTCKLL
jgi:hypothetical protein